ncbi:peptidase S41 [Thermocrinis albus DSM 14484]|uniref:Peptidase S41 n=1 Tax=Thermocrinis albus (strain DSM 14484 / JCM 11386 / HI 11/12) TaxID=638303 RepID=D3SPI8_THEAH|nr:S41 family peptidase [Thermocrinis albus]ADC89075.1 peptidase S41 [Thermocrinis albus DSM 14484]
MNLPIFLLLILLQLAYSQETCSREETLQRLREYIQRYYLWKEKLGPLPTWQDESEAIQFLRQKGDKWTTITNIEEDRSWYSEGKLVGIGIRWDDKGQVVRVFRGSPAEKAGIRPGDIIYSINGERDNTKWSVVIRNTPAEKPVELVLIRNGLFVTVDVYKGPFVVDPIEDVKVLEFMGKKLGYIHLVNFTMPALREFSAALEKLISEGIDGLVLDLRNNSGGLISVAKGIADTLIGGEGVMFYLESAGNGVVLYEFSNRKGIGMPILVLVNRNTASAGELLTALLKRYAKAVVAGENTFGKYVGSNVYPLNSCGKVVRLVTFVMKLPDGSPIAPDGGIRPDCPLGKDDSLSSALKCIKPLLPKEDFAITP